ncbi:MAG: hypothetical protein COW30_09980 [Rhodospirillales bacterium CG15_BIG_FIL_POST_REV_8_21_14_020_66_15]|nr:MAG: hypothetical protein COW30_09980 [Rhodospirillales bacterium CG15_BIG_FIL_POST_REV_8_21_14_020_66_15]
MRTVLRASALAALLGVLLAPAAKAQDKAARIMRMMDADGDGRVSAGEWQRKPKGFKRMDADGDGFLTMEELRARFGGEGEGGGAPAAGMPGAPEGRVPPPSIAQDVRCAILRGRNCDIDLAVARGLFPTGLVPRFPEGLDCPGIDEGWAIDYSGKRERIAYHGGIDMPAPFGEPMRAVADGTVLQVLEGADSYRGIEITLRHAPEDTGLSVWTYTQYAHFNEVPKLIPGQRVKRGDDLGPTGNSGVPGGRYARRPAIHFAVWYSADPRYAVGRRGVIPFDGHWMDPLALWRGKPPFDSAAMKALPEDDKAVPIAVIAADGETVPAGARITWPYTCSRN